MKETEAEVVGALYREVYRETFHGEPPDFHTAARGKEIHVICLEREDNIGTDGSTGRSTDGSAGGRGAGIAGFISVWKPGRFIHLLFVKREFRGQGVGRALTAFAGEHYGYPLTLRCRETNVSALQFYRADGWRVQLHGHTVSGGWYLLKKTCEENAPEKISMPEKT